LQKLREEHRELVNELREKKEELRMAAQELINLKGSLEGFKAQQIHLEDIRANLVNEINSLRESSRMELRRTERMEQTYAQVEGRLKALKGDIAKTEASYEKARNMTAEEEQRVSEQRRALRAAMEELANLELTMSQMNKQMYEERQQALSEMGQLSQAKQSVQQHMFMLSEGQKRMERNNAIIQSKLPPSDTPSNVTKSVTHLRRAPPIPFLQSPTDSNIPYTDIQSRGRDNSNRTSSNRGIRSLSPEEREKKMFLGDMGSLDSNQQRTNYFSVGQVQSGADNGSGDIELSEIQREVELLRKQSNAILQSTGRLTGT